MIRFGSEEKKKKEPKPERIVVPITDDVANFKIMSDQTTDNNNTVERPSSGKSVVMLQPNPIGEIIFSQGIAQFYRKGGYKVYWPVDQVLIASLRDAYPDVEWIHSDWYSKDEKVRYDLLHSLVAPLDKAYTFNAGIGSKLKAKYEMYGLDWSEWKTHAMWQRDTTKERALLEHLGITSGMEFTITNCPLAMENGNKKFIQLQKIDGFNWTHWAIVIALATQIHFTPRLDLMCILELIPKIKTSVIDLYPNAGTNYHDVEFILQRYPCQIH